MTLLVAGVSSFAKLQAKNLAARRKGLGIVIPRPIEMDRPRLRVRSGTSLGLMWIYV
jgi:hypothetical protein